MLRARAVLQSEELAASGHIPPSSVLSHVARGRARRPRYDAPSAIAPRWTLIESTAVVSRLLSSTTSTLSCG